MAGKNFDGLATRFRRNVYSSHKGKLRLAILKRDFREYLPICLPSHEEANPSQSLSVLDAGGGQGQFSMELAQAGHEVVLCDISEEMLAWSRQVAEEQNVIDKVQFVHAPIQDYCRQCKQHFDLVLCHALLEWVEEPQAVFEQLAQLVKPGGFLSLIYYNLNGLIYKNLLRTNFKKIRKQQWQGRRGSLTPTQPLVHEQIAQWAADQPLQWMCESGIRVFSDYIFDRHQRDKKQEELLEMELQYSRQQPYVHLGRYVHCLFQKQT